MRSKSNGDEAGGTGKEASVQQLAEKKEREYKITMLTIHMSMNVASEVCTFAARLKYFIEVTKSEQVAAAQRLAYLSSMTALLEFLVNPVAGALSDAYGRRPLLLLSPTVNCVGRMLCAVAPTPMLLALDRVVSGACGPLSGTTGTGAAASDIMTETAELGAALSKISAAAGVGVLIGPIIGRFAEAATGMGPRASFLCSAAMSAIQLLLCATQLPETIRKRVPLDPKKLMIKMNPLSFLELFRHGPTLSKLVTACAIQCFVEGKAMADINSAFMFNSLRMSDAARSTWLTCFGGAKIGAGIIGSWSVKMLGPRLHTSLQHLATVLSFSCNGLMPSETSMFSMAFFSLFAEGRGASMKALASKAAERANIPRGQFQGASANLRAIAIAGAPLLYSSVYAKFSEAGAAHRTYFVAALTIMIAEAIHRSIPGSALKALGPSRPVVIGFLPVQAEKEPTY